MLSIVFNFSYFNFVPELIIKIKGKRGRKIYGSNAYPEPKGTFTSFIRALNKLSKSKIEFEEEEL